MKRFLLMCCSWLPAVAPRVGAWIETVLTCIAC